MRILFLSHFLPYPPTAGAALRNYNLLKGLGSRNEVHLLTFARPLTHPDEKSVEISRRHMQKHCRSVTVLNLPTDKHRLRWYALLLLNIFSRDAYSTWQFYSRQMKRAITDAVTQSKFDIVHVDTIALAGYASRLHGLPAVLNHHNVESQLLLRRAATTRNVFLKAFLKLQGRKLARAERRETANFVGNICVSKSDCEELRQVSRAAVCRVISNGTDVEYFQPQPGLEVAPSLVFTGSMSWYPNAQGMLHFAKSIWPQIKKEMPETTMHLIGSNPPPEIIRVGERDPHFKVLGFVDDVRPIIAQASVYVVPISVGGGTRVKILDAMAMGKAIVSLPVGAEGLEVTDGKEIVIARESSDFAEAVVSLLRDEARRRSLGSCARETVVAKYSWTGIVPLLEEFYHEASGRKPQ